MGLNPRELFPELFSPPQVQIQPPAGTIPPLSESEKASMGVETERGKLNPRELFPEIFGPPPAMPSEPISIRPTLSPVGQFRIPVQKPEELPERGMLGDIAAATIGSLRDVAEMGLRGLRTISPFESAYEGEGLLSKGIEALKDTDKWDIMKPSKDVATGPWYRRWLYEGIRSSLPSLSTMITGAIAGQALIPIPGVGAAIGAAAGQALSAAPFGASEYDRFMEEAKEKGIGVNEARPYALASGMTEWMGETLGNWLGAKLLRMAPGGAVLTEPLKNTIRQMFKPPLKEGAKNMVKEYINETSTEFGQNAIENFLRQKAGMPQDVSPLTEGLESVGPTIVMTSIFGLGASGYNHVKRQQLYRSLENAGGDPQDRQAAVNEITNGLYQSVGFSDKDFRDLNELYKSQDPQTPVLIDAFKKSVVEASKDPETARQLLTIADQWQEVGTLAVQNNEPINIDQSIEDYFESLKAPIAEVVKPGEAAAPAPEAAKEAPAEAPWKMGEEVEVEGKPYRILNPAAFDDWANNRSKARRAKTLVKNGVIEPIKEEVGQVKPKEEKQPPTIALPPKAEPAPTLEEKKAPETAPVEKPRGIIPVAELWNKTPMDQQGEWQDAVASVEAHNAPINEKIKEVQKQLSGMKGQKGKAALDKRKALKAQVEELQGQLESLEPYEEAGIQQSLDLRAEAEERAKKAGLPEEKMEEFLEEFQMASSQDRPYIEYNHNKTVNQIFDETLADFMEEEAAAPAPEPRPVYREGPTPTVPLSPIDIAATVKEEMARGEETAKQALIAQGKPVEAEITEEEPRPRMEETGSYKQGYEHGLGGHPKLMSPEMFLPEAREAYLAGYDKGRTEFEAKNKAPAPAPAEAKPGKQKPIPRSKYPVFLDKNGKEYRTILHAVSLKNGWEWYGFEKQGKDIYYGFVHGFEDEFGSFSLAELKEVGGVHITTDPEELHALMPPVGWTKKEEATPKEKAPAPAPKPTEAVAPTPAPTPAPAPAETEYGSENKLVTKDRYEEIKKRLREKGGQLRVGIDPEMVQLGIEAAVYHIEAGTRKFADYARKLVEDVGDWVKPYLKSWYNAARDYPGVNPEGMETYEEVSKMDVDKIFQKPTMEAEGEVYGPERYELEGVEGAGEGALEEVPTEPVPSVGEGGELGAEVGERGELHPEGLRAGEEEAIGEGLPGEPGPRSGVGAGEGGMAVTPGPGPEGLREGEGEREPRPHATLGEQEPTPQGQNARNFRITPEILPALLETGQKAKVRNNIKAIRLLKQIESENRLATNEEKKVLAGYAGWGGLPNAFSSWGPLRNENQELQDLLTEEEYDSARASTPNAHYTTPHVANWMWRALERMGFKAGRALDPATGTGIFEGTLPDSLLSSVRLSGVELDSISGRIFRLLYPDVDFKLMGYENTKFPNNFFDVTISNVPFGDYKLHDRTYNKFNASIHDYFFLKSLDKIRPGGMLAFITSHYSMDSKLPRIRELISQKADLIAAFRLPDTAFQEIANTEVVTDIIFLRKKIEGQESLGEPWLETHEVTLKDKNGNEHTYHVNEYYEAHPDHIIGKQAATGKMYGAAQYNVEFKGDLEPRLNELMNKVPQNVITSRDLAVSEPSVQVKAAIPAPDYVKPNAFVVGTDGKTIYRNTFDTEKQEYWLEPVDIPEAQVAKTKRLIKLRDTGRELLHIQMNNESDDSFKEKMAEMNKEYDKFVKLYGFIRANRRNLVFAEDPDYALVLSLEKWDRAKKVATKADIFNKRVVHTSKQITHADTAKDALAITLSETGKIDFSRMTALTGKSEIELQRDLSGIIFKNPEGEKWETGDEYLSGNVREKLRIAEAAASADPFYTPNVEALRAVQPEDLSFDKIDARLGASWIDPSYISDFTREVLGIQTGLKVGYSPSIAMWTIERPRNTWAVNVVENTETYGNNYFYGHELLQMALNHKLPTCKDKDEEGNLHINYAATEEARDKQYNLKQRFKDWIWEDEDRRNTLVRKYNDEMNNLRPRTFDGSHLTLPGASDAITLRPHQKDGVWRITQTPTTLLAHVVGAGKTYTMIAGAMELRRMGIVKKPMIVVPNHLVEQWGIEFLKLYPNAQILIAGKDDFEPLKRNTLMSRIATGDWDAVIVPHTSFGKIPMSKEAQISYIQRQLDDLEAAIMELVAGGEDRKRSKIIKEIEKAKKRLLKKLLDKMKEEEKTVNVTFEELGVDQLFIDEAHEFKNLLFATKMQRVAGVSTANADKSSDLHMKTHHLLTKYNRGVVFATGTPISNSMVEMFTMQRYLQPDTLSGYKMNHFDAWAANFGEQVPSFELAPEGQGFRVKTRFKNFINIPELLKMFHQVADVKLHEDLNLPRPAIEGGQPTIIVSPGSDDLKAFIETLVQRAEAIRTGRVDPRFDNMLKVTTDGRKAALDMRLVNPALTSGADAKLNKAANNIYQIWKDTAKDHSTQSVFIDLSTPAGKAAKKKKKGKLIPVREGEEIAPAFDAYNDLKSKLIAMGIPKEEIAFIHDFDKEEAKQQLFDRINLGEVRIIFGSTKKLGFGTNMQQKMVAEHHLDAPWRPADIEQREGRILRQGNENAVVKIFRYVTEGSFDAYMWQVLENKAHSIAQIMTNKMDARKVEDIEEATLSYAEVKALATGDPLVVEKIKVDTDVRRLQMLRQQFVKNRYGIQDRIGKETLALASHERNVETIKEDLATRKLSEKFTITIQGKEYTDRKEAGNALQKVSGRLYLEGQQGRRGKNIVGQYAGFDLVIDSSVDSNVIRFGKSNLIANVTESDTGTIQSLEGRVRRMEDTRDEWAGYAEETKDRIEKLKAELAKDFPQEGELRKLLKRQEELDEALDLNRGQRTGGVEEEEEQPEAYLDEEAPKEKRGEEEPEREEGEYAMYQGWASVEGRRGVFDRYGHEVSGHSVEDIQGFIAPFIEKWNLGDIVKVVQAVEDVPKNHRKPSMAAVYLRDWKKIVMVADRLRSKEHAMKTLFHEALAHYGLREMFGDKMDSFLKLVYPRIPVLDLDHIVEVWGVDPRTPEGKLQAASEYLAILAERAGSKLEQPSLLQRLYAKVRQLLRDWGFTIELKDFEIQTALADSAQRLQRGERGRRAATVTGEEYALTQTTDNPLDLLKGFRSRYTLDISDKDLSRIRAFFGNPWDVAQKFPEFHKILDRQLRRDEEREQLIHKFLSNTVKDSPSRQHEFLALPAAQRKALFKVMVWCDANNTFYPKEEDLRGRARALGVGELTKEQVRAYYAWKRTMNEAWKMVLDQAERMIFKQFEDQPWIKELKTLAGRKKRGLTEEDKKRYAAAEAEVAKLSKEEKKRFGLALERIQKPASRIRRMRMSMGRIKFYVPRSRVQGKYVIRVYDQDDNLVHSERATNTFTGKKIEDRLEARFKGYTIEHSIEKGIPESIFQSISDASIEKFIQRAVDRAERKEEITPKDAQILVNALFEAVVDQLKGRGFGEHMIKRREGQAITGYETENGDKVFMDYITGLAGFLTKQEAAFDFYKLLHGIPIGGREQKVDLFQYSQNYIRDMLRNTTDLERLSGKVRSVAFAYWLSGNLKSAAVQFSQNFVTGIPWLGRETKKPQKKYVQAMKDVAVGHLSEEERKALDEAINKGITTNQYVREITNRVRGGFRGQLGKLVDLLAAPFSGMEIFNRKAAFLAMFRVARSEKRMTYEEAMEKARDYVYETHYLYGKANLPSWARSGTTGGAIARTSYTFRSFTHNFLISMIRSLKGPDGKVALDVLARSMAYLVLFGGLGSLPFLDDLLDELEKLIGIPYRTNMRNALKGIGGEMLAKFGMEGVPALIGVDLSGSLKIGLPKPTLAGTQETVYGVYGGLFDKGQRVLDAISREDFMRALESGSPAALENVLKAYRMASEAATTPKGKLMFDEQGRPIQLTAGEAIGQGVGFRPERLAQVSQEKRVLTNIQEHFKDKRDDLYAKYRMADTEEGRRQVLREIERYNLEIMKYQGAIPRITRETLKRTFRPIPNKALMRFEQTYA